MRAVTRTGDPVDAVLAAADVAAAQQRVARLVDDHGVTYNVADGPGAEPVAVGWEVDVVPLIVPAAEFDRLEDGMVQRSRVLDAVLTDLYGERTMLRRGLIPPAVVFRDRGYHRAAHGITIPGAHRLFFHAADVARCADGEYRVSADRTQAPSGVGYALADRSVVARAVPAAFQRSAPRPVSTFVTAMRLALVEAAPASAENPLVVVLSPGVWSETAFDQAHLASVLGFPLVESADLVVRDGALWMRALGTLRRVDVVLRRVDDDYVDPLDLRSDSRLGVVGLVEVARRGAVTVVNPIGSGVLENVALFGLMPDLCRALLGEEPILQSVPAFWAGDDAARSHIRARTDALVLHHLTTGHSTVGATLSAAEREAVLRRVEADPTAWAARQVPEPATAPVGPAGHREPGHAVLPRPVALRLFDVAGRLGYTVMAGGLAQVVVTDPPTEPMASTAAKDVWVDAADRDDRSRAASPVRVEEQDLTFGRGGPRVIESVSAPRVLADLFWMGRYSERAESTARMLVATNSCFRGHGYRSVPADSGDGPAALEVMLGALTDVTATAPGFAGVSDRATALGEFRSLTVDARRSGSLAHAIAATQTCARAVRDQLGEDTWAVFGRLDAVLGDLRNAPESDEATLWSTQSRAVGSLLAVAGLFAESMVRDPGWYLMDIGKRMERALHVTALLAATVGAARTPGVEEVVLEAVLGAADSSVTYRRRYRGAPRVGAVADLVLFDAGNPRSVIHQLDRIATDLGALPGALGTSRPAQAIDQIIATVRRVDPDDLENVDATATRAEFDDLLRTVHQDLRRLSELVTTAHLTGPGSVQPLWGSGEVRVLS